MYQSCNDQSKKYDKRNHADIANQNYHKSDQVYFSYQPMMDDGMRRGLLFHVYIRWGVSDKGLSENVTPGHN